MDCIRGNTTTPLTQPVWSHDSPANRVVIRCSHQQRQRDRQRKQRLTLVLVLVLIPLLNTSRHPLKLANQSLSPVLSSHTT
jgi:hypothetical protein